MIILPTDVTQARWVRLLQLIANRDEHALASFYDETSSRVYGLALRILGNPADADETTIDVYTQVWRTAASYSSQKASPLGWLLMIARSRSLDRLRSRPVSGTNLSVSETFASSPEDPESMACSAQRSRWVTAVMSGLPVEQRTLIEMSFYQGMTQSELASSLGLPLGTVKTRMRLAMSKLRTLMSEPQGSRTA